MGLEESVVLSSSAVSSNTLGITVGPSFMVGDGPIDMALNHGTYCSEASLEVLKRFSTNTSLRLFPSSDNKELRQALARDARVQPENVLVANGSGPLLKICLPHVIEKLIKQEVPRMVAHLIFRTGYPIYTPRLTYSKVPAGALKVKLRYEMLPLGPENNFRLDLEDLERRLERKNGLVYLANPNNPTGNVLVSGPQLRSLLQKFPQSFFVIDEAYVQYISEADHPYMGPLVQEFNNLLVLRSFSFAYGMGAARLGYALANKALIAELESRFTPHQVNTLTCEMAIAALKDQAHLDFVRQETAAQRKVLLEGLKKLQGLEAYDSQTNFILCRLSPGRTGRQVYDALLSRKVKVKIFEPLPGERYDEYFRITIGIPEENQYLLQQLQQVLNG